MGHELGQSRLDALEVNHSRKDTLQFAPRQWFYECVQCHQLLTPQSGDCCVFCCYATAPCPPVQLLDNGTCVGNGTCC